VERRFTKENKMQSIRPTLGKIESQARAVAIGVTALIVLGTLAWHYVTIGARSFMADMPQPQIVLKPGYQVLIDGHPSQAFGTDECPREADPQKAYWLGGRPDDIPARGCVVVGPTTNNVHVRLSNGVTEVWTIKHQERNGLPVTVVKRPNGEYVMDAR
jgi:hypothetical protein